MRNVIILTFWLAWLSIGFADGPLTNSTALSVEQESLYMARVNTLWHEYISHSATNGQEKLFEGGQALQRDYPNQINGWQLMMAAIEDCMAPAKARVWAQEMMDSPAPECFRLWAKGFLYRLDSQGKPVTMRFSALDGRMVDLAQLRGKVVLVDFWATHCGPCVAELPRVKAAFEKFHAEGFEVIGISCDSDKGELEKYVKQHGILWPQYFDGKQQQDNQFTMKFGIDGIPHMFLLDKKGCLRFDNVRAKGSQADFEDKINGLLSEE